ncbi:MAG: GNAT family N-acetyltransferase [Chloroflexota bacterium]|nr:GNAT family N-acetyltransferase [Chloroflexota bacterium]
MLSADDVWLAPPDTDAVAAAPVDGDVRESRDHRLSSARTTCGVRYFSVYAGNRLLGQILLHDIYWTAREALVAYHLFRSDDRGRGICTHALVQLQRYVSEHTDLRRLVVITAADNEGSRRVAERCGFQWEGRAREGTDLVVYTWHATS